MFDKIGEYTPFKYDNHTQMLKWLKKRYKKATYFNVVTIYNSYKKNVTAATLPTAIIKGGEETLKNKGLAMQIQRELVVFPLEQIEYFLLGLVILATQGKIEKEYYAPNIVHEKGGELKIILSLLAGVYILTKLDVI